MKIALISSLAIASVLGTILASSSLVNAESRVNSGTKTETRLKSCAPKNNPCASDANPCASKSNPCAAKKNPCASKSNPCAAKKNPCASKSNPCAAKKNPCASKSNPCASKSAKHPKVYTENGVALDGQDVVAYFTQKKQVAGTKQFTHKWNGATWQFSSANHRDLFAKNPEKYAPQYGGYCAKAASNGDLATTVPTAWEVRDGKLYLNYSAEAQQEWLQDTPKKIVSANQNWPKILGNDTLYR
ncbi:MAG: YHS domain-containing (seleno)protein [Pseudanabaenaceae cyanobacterium bins.68]|nr:YHS domain-containing (seleno)protein [Pseudanabaenaceae cyanobacterium bins.68]